MVTTRIATPFSGGPGLATNKGSVPLLVAPERPLVVTPPMALLVRVYLNAVFGGLGGLLGWLLFGVFGNKSAPENLIVPQLLLGGALIGGIIGYFVVSVEAIRD